MALDDSLLHTNKIDQETQVLVHSEGLDFEPHFTSELLLSEDVFTLFSWSDYNAIISNSKGEVVFEQRGVEAPSDWTQQSVDIVSSKYFYGKMNTGDRETSVKQLVRRVVKQISGWGKDGKYFKTPLDLKVFEDELTFILTSQRAAFNSPVWFNLGTPKSALQASACFILDVQDNMESILNWITEEGMIFKGGSGAGVNLSKIRSSKEQLSSGGYASGPVSFMEAADSTAGVIKSGGATRRAAKIVILNVDHPDILDFIWCKAKEEKKAYALIDAGYSSDFTDKDGAYATVQYQNANNSVRVSDSFMKSVLEGKSWNTRFVTTGEVSGTLQADDLLKEIAKATWECGDPGLQFDSTINRWHTCKASGRIEATNPCSEYSFLNNTACNLSSINLMKFYNQDTGEFLIEDFIHTVRVMTIAKEIIVGFADYPTEAIAENSYKFRTLGLGYANLGTLLMVQGLPYDSDKGRDYAAAVTSLLTGTAYKVSAEIAEKMGPFSEYDKNKDYMLEVIGMHRNASKSVNTTHVDERLAQASMQSWDEALELGSKFGYRNAQTSLLAPTGTIAFMMGCDTTGIEPDIALVKYKKLVGGGSMKIVNQSVSSALHKLGYSQEEVGEIINYIDQHDTIEGSILKEEHLSVFDCSFKPAKGQRSIHHMGHIKMLAAIQPFLSGSISKTVNFPTNATVNDIYEAYLEAWKMGVKCLAIYRDGCKRTQPLSTSAESSEETILKTPDRKKLPSTRPSITHKFVIGGTHEGYITVGMYEDGTPGEVFIVMSKEGSTISGLMDTLATTLSISLQHGVPLDLFIDKFKYSRFEPAGFTKEEGMGYASSISDYVFRWLEKTFCQKKPTLPSLPEPRLETHKSPSTYLEAADSPFCSTCGAKMVRNASCYLCSQCGSTSGCS